MKPIKPSLIPSLNDISTFETRSAKYETYISRIQQNRFTTGFSTVDKDIRGIGGGELMIIGAYSGTFKSAYLQNILMSYSKRSGFYSLFFSLEMPDVKVYEREMQIANTISGWDVERFSIQGQGGTDYIKTCRLSGAGKVLTIEKPRLGLDHIGEYIRLAKEEYEIGVVAIDYLGLMRGDTRSTTADLTENMSNGAKEIAKDTMLPVVLLTQINRAAAREQTDNGAEIELHHLKYGGEAGADIVLGLYRDPDSNLIMKVLKNRGGAIGKQWRAELTAHALQFNDFWEYTPPKRKRGHSYGLPEM